MDKMEKLRDYISFDLEFNEHQDKTHLIQVSAVRFKDGEEIGAFDSYVHTDVPLKSFINGLTGITSETLKDAPMVEEVLKNFQDFVNTIGLGKKQFHTRLSLRENKSLVWLSPSPLKHKKPTNQNQNHDMIEIKTDNTHINNSMRWIIPKG